MPELELSAGTIDYEDTGGDGPVVLLTHGLLMDGALWRGVIERLAGEHRCIAPTLPLGAHRRPMRPGADLSMRGIAGLLGELIERLDLNAITLAMNDWGGPQLLVGGPHDERIARLALIACEAFDNVPPRGAARMLPHIARIPGGLDAALLPFRVNALRRLPMTFGHLSKRAVPREVIDRWFEPVRRQRGVRADLRSYVLSSAQGRRELLEASEALGRFERPALVVWASEDKLMPREHGPRLAELLPRGELLVVEDSYTLIPEDQPERLAAALRELIAR